MPADVPNSQRGGCSDKEKRGPENDAGTKGKGVDLGDVKKEEMTGLGAGTRGFRGE